MSKINRREFLTTGAKFAAGVAALRTGEVFAQNAPDKIAAGQKSKTLGIQIGAVSFLDEGAEQVLDIVQQRARVNTVFLVTFAYNNGLAGRQLEGQPLPDHGKQEYDKNFHGGYYATLNPKYYQNTVFKAAKAPDHNDYDLLSDVLPKAKKRGLRTIAFLADNWKKNLPNGDKLTERDINGKDTNNVCFNNPEYRGFLLGMIEDCARSYPQLDGILWRSERLGPISRTMGLNHFSPNTPSCFCGFCEAKGKRLGIDFARAKTGYRALEKFVADSRAGKKPVDGFFVQFWRILIEHPEILAWERMQINDSLREIYRLIRAKLNSVRPNFEFGTALALNHSFNPIYRAEQDLQELAKTLDFVKVTMYHNVSGQRLQKYVDNLGASLLADLSKQELVDFTYRTMGYDEKATYEQLPAQGLSTDYVYRETKRSVAGATGTNLKIYSGVDAGLPTNEKSAKTGAQSTKEAVAAALKGGAHGIILSRKYSEMNLGNLSAAGEAVLEAGVA